MEVELELDVSSGMLILTITERLSTSKTANR